MQDGGTGLIGCTCNDTLPNLLQCHITTRNGNVWTLPVKWSLSSETQLLTCKRMRISVQSIRWPQKRVVSSQLSPISTASTCIDSSTCLVGDVAIYVVPICGSSSGFEAMSCFPEKLFTKGICFPYCMAIHMQHEGLQPLTMRGAAEWENGVVVAKRDCVPAASTTQSNSQEDPNIQTVCAVSMDAVGQSMSASSAIESQCSYDFTCTTVISNKSLITGYSSDSHVIPYIQTASGGVKLVLDGQPLVIAAGIQMRMYSSQADNNAQFVDFPTLVGNQYNEFTVEANSPVGIPVVIARGSTPSQDKNYELPRFIYPPPQYVQNRIPYNPATLSVEALWYATNPSYECLYSMINYCASKGTNAVTQLMILSSYAPMRLWRVRYQDGGCYISSQDGAHVCADDVALAASIDPAKEISSMSSKSATDSSQLLDSCTSGREFNLWVESLEDFDELNIVVGVRRGNMSDIASLLSEKGGEITRGKTVFYFVNKSNVSMVQEYVPWRLADGIENEIFGLSCPALRFQSICLY